MFESIKEFFDSIWLFLKEEEFFKPLRELCGIIEEPENIPDASEVMGIKEVPQIALLACTAMDVFIVVLVLIGIWRDFMSFRNHAPENHNVAYWFNMALAMARIICSVYFKPLNIIVLAFCGIAIIRGCVALKMTAMYGFNHNKPKKKSKKKSFISD